MSDTLETPTKQRRWSTVPTALLGVGAGAALTATAFLGVGMASAATAEPDSGTGSSETETPSPGTAEPGTTEQRGTRGGEHRRGGGDCDERSSTTETEETEETEEDSGTAS